MLTSSRLQTAWGLSFDSHARQTGELKVNKETKALDEIAGILLDAQHSEKMVDTTDGEVLDLIYAVMDKYTKEIQNA